MRAETITVVVTPRAPVDVQVYAKQGPGGLTGPAGTTDYNALTNKPTLGSAAAADVDDFAAADHDHAISDVTGLQSELDDIDAAFEALGTAAVLDVPLSPGASASSSQVVRGDDPRLTDARAPTTHGHADTEITSSGSGFVGATVNAVLLVIYGVTSTLTSGLASLVGTVSALAATVAALTSSAIANASGVPGATVTLALNALAALISANTASIATNTSAIATNTTNIATNTAAIAAVSLTWGTPSVVAATSYTLSASDKWKRLRFTNVAGCVVTCPSGIFTANGLEWIGLEQEPTAGQVSVVGSTATVNSQGGCNAKTRAPGTKMCLAATETANVADLFGDCEYT